MYRSETSPVNLVEKTLYPKLAKSDSDGIYCYFVQRRVSCFFTRLSAKLGISPNLATGIDFLFGVAASICIYFEFLISAVILIQLFGIWSCVDGEIARLTGKTTKTGDFYDTMTDRATEFLVTGGLLLLLQKYQTGAILYLSFFGYMGGIFLITASSEKYRSVWQKNDPKKQFEPFFSWLCAGSDNRLLYLSLGIIGFLFFKETWIVVFLVGAMALLLYLNFIFRLWKIFKLGQEKS